MYPHPAPRLARKIRLLLAGALLVATGTPASAARVRYVYSLADFSGTIPLDDVRLAVDRKHDEVYVAEGNHVRIFGSTGMELYDFHVDPAYGRVVDLAVTESGEILGLSFDYVAPSRGGSWSIVVFDYRGTPQREIRIAGLPDRLEGFRPRRLAYRSGRIYLVSTSQLLAVVADRTGKFERSLDLGALFEIEDEKRASTEIFGFTVGADGSLLFAVPVVFKAFVVAPDGARVDWFGKPGSAPGKFGIVTGIAETDDGHVLVTDRLRSVVMVFDQDFRFLTEFGYRGPEPWNLISPSSPTVGNDGRVYVTQKRKMGVSVLEIDPR